MRTQSVISTKLELSVPLANENEVHATKVITSDDQTHLKQLWKKFHNRIKKLDENNNPSGPSNDEENNKRYPSASVTDEDSDKELEPVQHNTKRMRTYQVGT